MCPAHTCSDFLRDFPHQRHPGLNPHARDNVFQVPTTEHHRANVDTFVNSLLQYFFDFIPIGSIIKIGQLSKPLRIQTEAYVGCLLTKTIRPWIESPPDFRHLMLKYRAVVSGSVALGVVLHPSFHSKDMDVYVGKGNGKSALIQYLTTIEGYAVTSEYILDRTPYPGLVTIAGYDQAPRHTQSITMLTHPSRLDGLHFPRLIKIVESNTLCAITPIFDFNATWMMNYITGDGIHVAYPNQTFRRSGVWCRTTDHTTGDWAWRIVSRHLRISELNWRHLREEGCGSLCPGVTRTSTDKWWMHYSVTGMEEGPTCVQTWVRRWAGHCWDVHCPRFNLDIFKARRLGVSHTSTDRCSDC